MPAVIDAISYAFKEMLQAINQIWPREIFRNIQSVFRGRPVNTVESAAHSQFCVIAPNDAVVLYEDTIELIRWSLRSQIIKECNAVKKIHYMQYGFNILNSISDERISRYCDEMLSSHSECLDWEQLVGIILKNIMRDRGLNNIIDPANKKIYEESLQDSIDRMRRTYGSQKEVVAQSSSIVCDAYATRASKSSSNTKAKILRARIKGAIIAKSKCVKTQSECNENVFILYFFAIMDGVSDQEMCEYIKEVRSGKGEKCSDYELVVEVFGKIIQTYYCDPDVRIRYGKDAIFLQDNIEQQHDMLRDKRVYDYFNALDVSKESTNIAERPRLLYRSLSI